jgi:hypothetical protein
VGRDVVIALAHIHNIVFFFFFSLRDQYSPIELGRKLRYQPIDGEF